MVGECPAQFTCNRQSFANVSYAKHYKFKETESTSKLSEITLKRPANVSVFNLLEVSLFLLEAEDSLTILYVISRGACPPPPKKSSFTLQGNFPEGVSYIK